MRFEPFARVLWVRPSYPPVQGVVIRDSGSRTVKVRIAGRLYHPRREHLRDIATIERSFDDMLKEQKEK